MLLGEDPFWRSTGAFQLSATQLFRGRATEAIRLLDQSFRAYAEPGMLSAEASAYAAHVLLEKGEARRALEEAGKARRFGQGDLAEWQGLYFASLAQARLGRAEEAEKTAEELRRKAEALPSEREKRRSYHLMGELALSRGDTARALEHLRRAEALLPPRGFPGPVGPPQHVPIWYSLGSAYLAAGENSTAAEWFRRVAESANEHIEWPIPYVRSFYFLGKIHEARGEKEKARDYYRRFVDYWKDGELDRPRLDEARGKI
jgi:tetratricopeptide (TPR) repeat protein